MSSANEPASAPREGFIRRIPTGYKVVAVMVLLVILAVAGRILYFDSKINSELAAIRKAGFPVTLDELNAWYPMPSGENAADTYEAAFAAYGGDDSGVPLLDDEVRLPPRGHPLPEDMRSKIAAYLAANAQALALLHKGGVIEGCRFHVNATQAYDMPLPHLNRLRQAARLLELEILLKADEGKPDEAAAAIADSFAIARHLRNEPILRSQLVRIAVDFRSLEGLERVLSRIALGDKPLADLAKSLEAEESQEGILRGMVGERCEGLSALDDPRELGAFNTGLYSGYLRPMPYRDPSSGMIYLYRFGGLWQLDRLKYLQMTSELVGATGGTMKDMRERDAQVCKEAFDLPETYLISRLVLTSLTSDYDSQLNCFARLRAARAGIAVERFRMANGRLPESLDQLVPKFLDSVPSDPWDDKPIRYKKLTKGFVTYSVGPDLKDDGGKERDSWKADAPYDITFTVER